MGVCDFKFSVKLGNSRKKIKGLKQQPSLGIISMAFILTVFVVIYPLTPLCTRCVYLLTKNTRLLSALLPLPACQQLVLAEPVRAGSSDVMLSTDWLNKRSNRAGFFCCCVSKCMNTMHVAICRLYCIFSARFNAFIFIFSAFQC